MMKTKTFLALILSFSTLAVAACATKPKLEDANYWQRKNASSALYLRGPKAQQMLHKNIADCVTEIDELARLGPLREALPADTGKGIVPDRNTAEGRMKKWDSPKRDGYLYAEHFDYTDFEGCMDSKGWERVEHLPYDRATEARKDYLRTIHGYKYQTDHSHLDSSSRSADPYASSPSQKIND